MVRPFMLRPIPLIVSVDIFIQLSISVLYASINVLFHQVNSIY